MSDTPHEYDIRVPNAEIRRLLADLERPHRDERVLYYLHFELGLSSRELGDLFGVTRQAIQKIVRDFEWNFHGQRGGSHAVGADQLILTDFEERGLSDYL